MRLPVVLIVVMAACHSAPFVTPADGALGPFSPGAEARLTYSGPDAYGHAFAAFAPTWAENGTGILYTFSPRLHQAGESLAQQCQRILCFLGTRDSLDTCLGLLPPTGGSAYWNMCETRPFHTDSIDIFTAAALNSAGQMLYVEMSGPTTHPFPLSSHAELWLGGAGVFAPRQKLLTLYHDNLLGIDETSPGAVNWLSEVTWAGSATFLAIGGHLFPGDSIRPRGLVLGTITASGATISVVPGTASDSISHFGLISGGSAIVFVDSTAVIRRVDVASGATQVMATLPASAGKTLDISCRPDACVVLTSDGAQWGLWKLDLASGVLTQLRAFGHALTAAKLSPVTGDVVALEGVNLFFLPAVLP